jgi:hypothetical protein
MVTAEVVLILTVLGVICEPWEMVILVAFVIYFAPSDAQACHLHRVWRYPWPQRCYVALAPSPKPLDRWNVEITTLPEDIARDLALDLLRDKLAH